MHEETIWAEPRTVTDIKSCYFYHTVEIPGHGEIRGVYDLRTGTESYLGGVSLAGKRVLEIGVASGFLSGYMESKGADVVGIDVSKDWPVDIVPFAGDDLAKELQQGREFVERVNNSYWLYHQAKSMKAKMLYTSAYAIPEEVGQVDVSTFCDVLLHLRDPFWAMFNALRLTRETVVITEPLWRFSRIKRIIFALADLVPLRFMVFNPNFRTHGPNNYTWWLLPPQIIREFLGVLGFEKCVVTFHSQKAYIKDVAGMIPHYTIVAQRTRPMQISDARIGPTAAEYGRICDFV